MAATEFDFPQGRLIGVTRLDTGFTGSHRDPTAGPGWSWTIPTGPAGATLWADERFGYLMVYTGDTLDPSRRAAPWPWSR